MPNMRNLTIVHETCADGRHRIVALRVDGTSSAGDWVEGRAHPASRSLRQ